MKASRILLVMLITAAGTCALTRYYWPRIVAQTKEVEVTHTVTRTRVVSVPGKTITETIIVERDSKTKTDTKFATSNWHAAAGVSTQFNGLKPIYSATLDRRILGPFFIGAAAGTDGSFGVRLGMEF